MSSFNDGFSGEKIEWDRHYNLLFIEIHPFVRKQGLLKTKEGLDGNKVSNLGVYDINNETLNYLFTENDNKEILSYYFEKSYDKKNKRMEFSSHFSNLINNEKIKKRAISDRLFFITKGKEEKSFEFWKSEKSGNNKQKIKDFSIKDFWKIDVANKKILFFRKSSNRVHIDSFDW